MFDTLTNIVHLSPEDFPLACEQEILQLQSSWLNSTHISESLLTEISNECVRKLKKLQRPENSSVQERILLAIKNLQLLLKEKVV